MSNRAAVAGHPIHPMLVTIPIGLFVFSLVADIAIYLGYAGAWPEVAFYCMGGGIVGALLAAVFGLVDLLAVRADRPVLRIGLMHMVINLVVVALFALNFALRWQDHTPTGTPMLLSVAAVLLLLVSGWLGGHMVFVHGVAVQAPGTAPTPERRKVQMPVRVERRRAYPGQPIGQH